MKPSIKRWHSIVATTVLFASLATLISCRQAVVTTSDSAKSAGVISLISNGGQGADACHYDVENRDIARGAWGCNLYSLKYINFTEVPSATTIRFIEYDGSSGCSDNTNYRFYIEFKTTGIYSTDRDRPLELAAILRDAKKGETVDGNFRVTQAIRQDHMDNKYPYVDKIDCFQIRDPHTASASKAPPLNPRLLLTDADDRQCTIPITGADIRKTGWKADFPGCSIRKARWIQLIDVPSAVTIYLRSFGFRQWQDNGADVPEPYNDCDRAQDLPFTFRIAIKTTANINGPSARFDINDMLATPVNSAVIGNVRLMERSTGGVHMYYPISEYLSCFKFDLGQTKKPTGLSK